MSLDTFARSLDQSRGSTPHTDGIRMGACHLNSNPSNALAMADTSAVPGGPVHTSDDRRRQDVGWDGAPIPSPTPKRIVQRKKEKQPRSIPK